MCLKALHMASMNLGESTIQYKNNINIFMRCITLLRSIKMFCGSHNIPHNIPCIHSQYWEYFHKILSFSQNTIMDLNNVMCLLLAPIYSDICILHQKSVSVCVCVCVNIWMMEIGHLQVWAFVGNKSCSVTQLLHSFLIVYFVEHTYSTLNGRYR